MVQGNNQGVFGRAELNQGDSQRVLGVQIEGPVELGLDQSLSLGLTCCLRGLAQVDPFQFERTWRVNDLNRGTIRAAKAGTERPMSSDNRRESLLQFATIDYSFDAGNRANVVQRQVGLELVEKPQALLSK